MPNKLNSKWIRKWMDFAQRELLWGEALYKSGIGHLSSESSQKWSFDQLIHYPVKKASFMNLTPCVITPHCDPLLTHTEVSHFLGLCVVTRKILGIGHTSTYRKTVARDTEVDFTRRVTWCRHTRLCSHTLAAIAFEPKSVTLSLFFFFNIVDTFLHSGISYSASLPRIYYLFGSLTYEVLSDDFKSSFLGKYAHFAKLLLIMSKKPFSQES